MYSFYIGTGKYSVDEVCKVVEKVVKDYTVFEGVGNSSYGRLRTIKVESNVTPATAVVLKETLEECLCQKHVYTVGTVSTTL